MARSPTLRLTRLSLGNWRNFNELDVALQRRVFLVGPNAAGKSNLLDAVRFLHDLVKVGGGLQAAAGDRGGVSKIRSLSARRYSDVSLRIAVDSNGASGDGPAAWEYELRFNQDNRQRPRIKVERVTREGSVLLDRPDPSDEEDPERLTQTYLEQVQANRDFRDVAGFLQTVRYLHIVPQLIREPDRSVGRRDDPYGGDFLEQIASTRTQTREARLRKIVDALRVAVPQLAELVLERDERGVPHLRGRYEHWRPHGAWQEEDQFSDGTLRLLGLLWAVLDGQGPLLLEEPELSLHPEVVRYVAQMLHRAQRSSGRQVVLSTHSSDLLRDEGIGLDEVLLLQPDSEGTRVSLATTHEDIRALLEKGVSLADAVMPKTRPDDAQQLVLFGGGGR